MAVYLQVSGELSNDGEPMRRFTQTFVLGVESPRKYYVHNDIFRYQDMLLTDEGGDSPSGDEDIEQIQDDQPDVSIHFRYVTSSRSRRNARDATICPVLTSGYVWM